MFLIGVSKPDLGQHIAGTNDKGAADGEEHADIFVAHVVELIQNRDRNAQGFETIEFRGRERGRRAADGGA